MCLKILGKFYKFPDLVNTLIFGELPLLHFTFTIMRAEDAEFFWVKAILDEDAVTDAQLVSLMDIIGVR